MTSFLSPSQLSFSILAFYLASFFIKKIELFRRKRPRTLTTTCTTARSGDFQPLPQMTHPCRCLSQPLHLRTGSHPSCHSRTFLQQFSPLSPTYFFSFYLIIPIKIKVCSFCSYLRKKEEKNLLWTPFPMPGNT